MTQMEQITIGTQYDTQIQVYRCASCGTTYRKSVIIRRFWKHCPNCGEEIESWLEPLE